MPERLKYTAEERDAYLHTLNANRVKIQGQIVQRNRQIRHLNDKNEQDQRQLKDIERSIYHLEGE